MISLKSRTIYIFYILIGIVYACGIFLPLMENDSAQHAVMAMRMYLEDDFFTIMRGPNDYLDKPHMHFWLSALSYKLFGIHAWAYRIPALLFTLLGAVSCYQLTKELYHKKLAHIGALVFLTSQSIILANHDVRTDAVLTGATIFSIWQLFLFTKTQKILPMILGAIGMGIAFSTKGFFGVFIIGVSLFFHLLYTRNLRIILSYKTVIGLVIFAITIIPVLLAYHSQFGEEGVRFILWNQNFDRLNATNLQKYHSDYFYLFHTLFWVFLPWALIFYVGLFKRIQTLIKNKFKPQSDIEVLSFAGAFITLLLLSFSQFKLPHYLNPFIPLFSIFVVGFLDSLMKNSNINTVKVFLYILYILVPISIIGTWVLLFSTFDLPKIFVTTITAILMLILAATLFKKEGSYAKVIKLSITMMIFINFGLNSYFYPELLKYQSGIPMSKLIQEKDIPLDKVYIHNEDYSWTLDFYTRRNTLTISTEEIKNLKTDIWLYSVKETSLQELKEEKFNITDQYTVDHFRVTRLNLKFLNPETRQSKLSKAYLFHITP